MPDPRKWYYRRKFREFGSFTTELFKEMVSGGSVPADSEISNDSKSWRSLQSDAEVSAWLKSAPEPRPGVTSPRPNEAALPAWMSVGNESATPAKEAVLPDWMKLGEAPVSPPSPPAPAKPVRPTATPPSTLMSAPLPPLPPPAPPPVKVQDSWFDVPKPEPLTPPPLKATPAPSSKATPIVAPVPLPPAMPIATPAPSSKATPAVSPAIKTLPLSIHPHEIPGVIAWSATAAYGKLHMARRFLWALVLALPVVTLLVPFSLIGLLGGAGGCFLFLLIPIGIVWLPGLYLSGWRWARYQHERKISRLACAHATRMSEYVAEYLTVSGIPLRGATFEFLPDGAFLLVTKELLCWTKADEGKLSVIQGDQIREVRHEKVHLRTVTTSETKSHSWKVSMPSSGFVSVLSGGALLGGLSSLGWSIGGEKIKGKVIEENQFAHYVYLETGYVGLAGLRLDFGNDEAAKARVYQVLQTLVKDGTRFRETT